MNINNDKIILDGIIEAQHNRIAPHLGSDEYFEIFSSEQITKDIELSFDEIIDGSTGNSPGIDAIFTFINGEYIQEDTDVTGLKNNIVIDLRILEAKNKNKFEEGAIDKLMSITDDLFDLSRELDELRPHYNEKILELTDRFRKAYKICSSYFPLLRVSFHYTSRGSHPSNNMRRKADILCQKFRGLFPKSECSFTFHGATELLNLASQLPNSTISLSLKENAISTEGETDYICLVKLSDYFNFIKNSDGKLNRGIFEANVRDYQGNNSVNKQIQQTLQSEIGEDFWWLNNGVTILASRAEITRKTLQIQNPEIVNGLQTSFAVFNYFSSITPQPEDPRNILIRVIVPSKPESRDRIIRATNSQTPIPEEALRSTDQIHRRIEEYLKRFEIYYDRRKNYYKNQRMPLKQIISIKQMAQAVMSVALHKPDDAKGRPNDLIKDNTDYRKIFNEDYHLNLYHFCANLLMEVERILRSDKVKIGLDQKSRLETKFHIMMYVTVLHTRNLVPVISQIQQLKIEDIESELLVESAHRVLEVFMALGATNKVVKGTNFYENLMEDLKTRLG